MTPLDCSPPGSYVPGILQARILEWVAISFSRGSSWLRDQTYVFCIGRQILYHSPSGILPGCQKRVPKSRPEPGWEGSLGENVYVQLGCSAVHLKPSQHCQFDSLVAQLVKKKKKCLKCGRPKFNAWVGTISWRRKRQPTPVFLPGESHGQRSLVGYSPWSCRVRHD